MTVATANTERRTRPGYYGRPVLHDPVWKKEVPWYLFSGGLAGASSLLAAAGRAAGRAELARVARRVALGGALASPALLIADLGCPSRFFNMLRVVRPTSPMNMGAWLLSAYGPAAAATAVLDTFGIAPAACAAMDGMAAILGAGLATYTGVLIGDTAVPAWHEAHRHLPLVFAASAATSAGAAAALFVPAPEAAPARRLAVAGVLVEQAAMHRMVRHLGPLGPYDHGPAGRYHRAATVLGLAGAVSTALAGHHRRGRAVGAGLLLASAVASRFAVFKAGFQSAADPEATITPQRARLAV